MKKNVDVVSDGGGAGDSPFLLTMAVNMAVQTGEAESQIQAIAPQYKPLASAVI